MEKTIKWHHSRESGNEPELRPQIKINLVPYDLSHPQTCFKSPGRWIFSEVTLRAMVNSVGRSSKSLFKDKIPTFFFRLHLSNKTPKVKSDLHRGSLWKESV